MGKRIRRTKKLDHKVYSREDFLKRVHRREEKWVLTNEDWYPSVDGKIHIALNHDRRYNQKLREYGPTFAWRVSVWGADDTGMEQSFDSLEAAQQMFKRIVDLTTKAQLFEWGFGRV